MAYNRPFSYLQNDQGKVSEKNRKTVPLLTPKPSSPAEKSGSVSVSNVIAYFNRSQQATGSSIGGGQHGIQQGAGRTRYSSSSIHAVLVILLSFFFILFSQDFKTTHRVSPTCSRERNQQGIFIKFILDCLFLQQCNMATDHFFTSPVLKLKTTGGSSREENYFKASSRVSLARFVWFV
jgi:hypothetical protein